MMDGVGRDFPPGDFRVSDADRDRALSELSEAFRVGRLTADEFDQRSGQTLRARTGRELNALLADLPVDDPPAARGTSATSGHRALAVMTVIRGASAVAAAVLSGIAVANAVIPGISAQQGTGSAQPGTSLPFGESIAAGAKLLPFIKGDMNPPLQAGPVPLTLPGGHGRLVRLPPSPGFDWVGTITPAAIAVLLVLLIIFLSAARTDRDPVDTLIADQ